MTSVRSTAPLELRRPPAEPHLLSRLLRLRNSTAVAEIWLPIFIRIAMMATLALVVAALRVPAYGPYLSRFSLWDAQWYATITEHGYPGRLRFGTPVRATFGYPEIRHVTQLTRLAPLTRHVRKALLGGDQYAFFPLFPAVCWVVSRCTGLSATDSGLVVAWVSSCALGPLVYRVAKNTGGSPRGRYLAVVLLGLLPMAIVFQMGYAEALFTALGLAAFACAQQRRWVAAGVFAVLAGLTRPVGYVIAIGILAVGLVDWFSREDRNRRQLLRILLASGAGAAATPLMWAYTALRLHKLTAWFSIQKLGWNTRFDLGSSTYHFLAHELTHPRTYWAAAVPAALYLLGALAAVIVLTARGVRRPALVPYAVMAGVSWLTVALSSNYWNSKPRLLLLCFILVVPAGIWLGRRRRWVAVTLLCVATLTSYWYGAYMITRWPHAI